jgi:thiol:disulfide interchange protein DsbC
MPSNPFLLALAAAALAAAPAFADEAAIRKNLAERLPNFPKIDEVTKTPVPGIYELRIGTDVFYSDENGNHLIQGSLYDTRARINLTQQRVDKLTAIAFGDLPLKDAMVFKQGSGTRKLAVFVDPNCGYCKRFERDLVALKDVTIYAFLYPILGPDSEAKSRAIWCAKDASKTWRDWMIGGQVPATASGACDTSAIERNVAFGHKHRVSGTPAVFFQDGTRVPGAIPAAELEKQLALSSAKP